MFRLPSILLVAAFLSTQGAARAAPTAEALPSAPVPAGEVADIRNVILAQLEAFKADDGTAAFSFAAPEIRKIFRTP